MYFIVTYNVLFVSVCLSNIFYQFITLLFSKSFYSFIHLAMLSFLSYTTQQFTIALACAKEISIDATVVPEWYFHTNSTKLLLSGKYIFTSLDGLRQKIVTCVSNVDMKCSCQQEVKNPCCKRESRQQGFPISLFSFSGICSKLPPPHMIVLTL